MFENIPLFTRVLTVALLCCSCPGETVSAASPSDDGAKPTVVRLGVPPLGDTLLPVIGAKKGWYKDEGLKVEIKALDWNEIHASLTAGKIDVGISNIATTVATHAKAPEIVYAYALNTFDNGLALMVRPDGGLKPLDTFLGQLSAREEAIAAAHKILRSGGQIMILDLLKHNFEQAHELYGDRRLGFAESDLHHWLENAGFKKIEISVVAREEQPPHFQTILAGAEK